ncbi:MAG: hypothetical protein PHO10_04710 [Gemmiger sp.]|nr:hypothetical protein [Gemmiger sp.]
MKNKLRALINQYMLLLWLALGLVVLLATASFAAYTNSGYKKGVATTNGSAAMFSANCLLQYDAGTTTYGDLPLAFPKDTGDSPAPVSYDIIIYNRSPYDATQINPEDITYTLKVTIQGLATPANYVGYSINDEPFDATGTCTIPSQKLAGGRASSNTYKLTLPYAGVGSASFVVTATPEPASNGAVNSKMLARNLYTTEYTQATAAQWAGTFADSSQTTTPANLDAFNYAITGSGAGTFTLTWDTTYLQLDPFFQKEITTLSPGAYTAPTAGNTTASLAIPVSATTQSYYLVQFYRTAAPNATTETWERVAQWVTYTFESSQAATG